MTAQLIHAGRSAALLLVACLVLAVPAAAQDTSPVAPAGDAFWSAPNGVANFPVIRSPEDVLEAESALIEAALQAVPATRTEDGGFLLGDPDAPVRIIEFSDWACPACQAYRDTIDALIETYVVTGQAAFEFRMFPTAGGARTIEAGRYAECLASEDPADFWRAVPLLYHLAETGAYTGFAAALAPLADRTAADLEACAAGAEQVNTDTQLGRLLGVQGTPAVLVQYADSDLPEFITLDGTTYNRGAVPLEVLGAVIAAAQ